MQIELKSWSRCQSGFSMFEILLAMVVVVFMSIMVVKMQKTSSDELHAKTNADSMQVFVQGAMSYLANNRADLVAVMRTGVASDLVTPGSNWCGVWNGTAFDAIYDKTTNHTCAVDINWLKNVSPTNPSNAARNVLPAAVPATNYYGQTWVAIYKLVNAADANSQDVEVLIVASGGSTTPSNEYSLAASLLGGAGGFFAGNTSICGSDICGSGGWKTNLSDFGAVKQ